MIVLASVFRNSTEYLARHEDQVERLRKIADEAVFVIAVEGDSTDDTYNRLIDMEYADEILKCEHGGPMFDSHTHSLRWRQLSVACNTAMCAAYRTVESGDAFVYIESDLIWEPDTIIQLVDHLRFVHAVAPMSMAWEQARFYDVFGYQRDGKRFSPYPPYYEGWTRFSHDLVPIDSSGSCFVLDHYALKYAEFSAEDCIRGVGRTLRENGITLHLDPTAQVWHP